MYEGETPDSLVERPAYHHYPGSMSIMAKPLSSIPSARLPSPREKPAASPSTSALTKCCTDERVLTFLDTPGS